MNRILDGGEFIDSIKDEINHLVVELNQTAERNIGIIEARINRLQKLVDSADRKIALLGKEREKVKLGREVYDRLKKSAPLVATSDSPSTETAVSPVPKEAADAALPEPGRSSADEVLDLHRQGFDTRLIASRTGSTLGEVELIISLAHGKE